MSPQDPVPQASAKERVIRAIYAQVGAPDWAAPNLDALADVLRDLAWLRGGVDVAVQLPDLTGLSASDRETILAVLRRAVAESATSTHPVHLRAQPEA